MVHIITLFIKGRISKNIYPYPDYIYSIYRFLVKLLHKNGDLFLQAVNRFYWPCPDLLAYVSSSSRGHGVFSRQQTSAPGQFALQSPAYGQTGSL